MGGCCERQRLLHGRIVAAIEQHYTDRLADQVERLAHHALRGEVWDKALAYCRQAGDKALARSAGREAVACFEQALVAVEHLPEGRERHEQAIDVRFGLRPALVPQLEHGRSLTYLREAEGSPRPWATSTGWAGLRPIWPIFGPQATCTRCRGGPARPRPGRDPGRCGTPGRDAPLPGPAYYALGDYPQAIDLLRQNLVALEGTLLRERFGLPGLPSVMSRDILARCLAQVGAFTEGLAHGEDSLRIAEAVNHPNSLIVACYASAMSTSTKAHGPRRSRGSNAAWTSAGSGTFRSCSTSSPRSWAMRMCWLDGCPKPCRCWSRVSRQRP